MRQSDTYDRVPCVSKSSRHNKSPAAVAVGGGHKSPMEQVSCIEMWTIGGAVHFEKAPAKRLNSLSSRDLGVSASSTMQYMVMFEMKIDETSAKIGALSGLRSNNKPPAEASEMSPLGQNG